MTIEPTEWVMVPREPTEAMLDEVCSSTGCEPFTDKIMGDIYKAMLSAAPTPPSSPAGEVPATDVGLMAWIDRLWLARTYTEGTAILQEFSDTERRRALAPPTGKELAAHVKFLNTAATYFSNRPTGGEDAEHWANVYNAKNCEGAAAALTAQATAIEGLKATPDFQRGIKAAFDFLQMRAANNWHANPEQQKLREIENEALTSAAEDVIHLAPDHESTWRSLTSVFAELHAAEATVAELRAEVERLTGLRATDNKTWIMRATTAEAALDAARAALTKAEATAETLRRQLREAADRFQDIGELMDSEAGYRNSGFLRASAVRYRDAALTPDTPAPDTAGGAG